MADAIDRASAFNFCNPFDTVLPVSGGSVVQTSRQQLWGLYSGILAGALVIGARISAFNFCNPFDHVLPAPGTFPSAARAHLWGLYTDISTDPPVPEEPAVFNYPLYRRARR